MPHSLSGTNPVPPPFGLISRHARAIWVECNPRNVVVVVRSYVAQRCHPSQPISVLMSATIATVPDLPATTPGGFHQGVVRVQVGNIIAIAIGDTPAETRQRAFDDLAMPRLTKV